MRYLTKLVSIAALGAVTASCGDVVRSGRAPVFLVLDSIGAVAGGATDQSAKAFLQSDVLTLMTTPAPCTPTSPCPTYFNDSGQATMHLAMKDITTGVSPSSNNAVTINRYHVSYRRADGRNTPGVDVPYGFDGAVTALVAGGPGSSTSFGFELVRNMAKTEAPLAQLVTNPVIITAIADITFYGQDQVGNDIQASGSIQVDFGNFADR